MSIYLDNAATTAVLPEASAVACDTMTNLYANPASLHTFGFEAEKLLEKSRETLAKAIGCKSEELFFTSGGTGSDNLAVLGYLKTKRGGRIITSAYEHPAVLECFKQAESKFDVVYLKPENGIITEEALQRELTPDTVLVSVMHVNNETGAVNDLQKIVKLTKSVAPKSIVHSDGVQALMKVKVNLMNLGVDMYSVSAHKVHAPRGVGGLYIRKGVRINPLILGGGQEKGLRSATENLAGIVAFSKILEKFDKMFSENVEKRKAVLDYLRQKISETMPEHIIVSPENSPHILMIALKGVRGEVMLHSLEDYGILIGVGSACSSKKGINKFQSLLNLDDEHKEGIIRVSVSETNTIEECDFFLEKLKYLTDKLTDYKRI